MIINDAYNANYDVDVDDADADADELDPKTRDRKQTVRHPEDSEAQGGVQQQNDDEDEVGGTSNYGGDIRLQARGQNTMTKNKFIPFWV